MRQEELATVPEEEQEEDEEAGAVEEVVMEEDVPGIQFTRLTAGKVQILTLKLAQAVAHTPLLAAVAVAAAAAAVAPPRFSPNRPWWRPRRTRAEKKIVYPS